MDQRISGTKVITFAGAFIAFLIGSGFATGQEILQYFTSYGYWGIAGALVVMILLIYIVVAFITVGYQEKFEKPSDIFAFSAENPLGCFLISFRSSSSTCPSW